MEISTSKNWQWGSIKNETLRDDFNFPILNFPFICSNIPAAPKYGVYISQMIRYSRACASYQDFLDMGVAANKETTEPRVPFGKIEVITSKILRSPPSLGWPLWNICVTNDDVYAPLVVSTSRSFLHSRRITGFATRLTRRVPLVEQELPTFPEHMSTPPVFSGVRVTQSLVLWVCFVNRCLSLFLFVIVLSVLFRFTDSDYPFGIFKLFLHCSARQYKNTEQQTGLYRLSW